MILYVNGDSHTAAAEAVVPHAFAEDDPFFTGLGRRPHPDNERASWGCELANQLRIILDCDAESASSNARIMRTTREWLAAHSSDLADALVIIQWSTWEREEWLIDGKIYQINASGQDWVPKNHQDKYQQWILDLDWRQKTQQAHEEIWQLHQDLIHQDVRHLFFNGNNHFGSLLDRRDWRGHYLAPYDPDQTFDRILRSNGFKTVRPDSWHFGADAHCFWADFMLQYINHHKL